FHAVAPKGGGDVLDEPLVDERRDREAYAPVSTQRRFVGRNGSYTIAVEVEVVRSRDHRRGAERLQEVAVRIHAIGTHVDDDVGVYAADASLVVDNRTGRDVLVAGVAGRRKILDTVLDPSEVGL